MDVAQAPDVKEVVHPLIRTHPETGRKALYLSTTHYSRLDGMTESESKPLMEQLCAHAVRPEFTCRFNWQPNSMVLWDNRSTQHKPVNDFFPATRRLHRVVSEGDQPY